MIRKLERGDTSLPVAVNHQEKVGMLGKEVSHSSFLGRRDSGGRTGITKELEHLY